MNRKITTGDMTVVAAYAHINTTFYIFIQVKPRIMYLHLTPNKKFDCRLQLSETLIPGEKFIE